MRCGSRSCDCNKPWKRGRSGAIGVAYRERKTDGQRETLARLIRSAPIEAVIRSEASGTTWITIDGFTAPIIVEHGFVTLRTNFEPHACRTIIELPKRRRSDLISGSPWASKYIARVVKESHVNFAAYAAMEALRRKYEAILGNDAPGQYLHIKGLTADGQVVVEATLRLTLEQATKFTVLLKEIRDTGEVEKA